MTDRDPRRIPPVELWRAQLVDNDVEVRSRAAIQLADHLLDSEDQQDAVADLLHSVVNEQVDAGAPCADKVRRLRAHAALRLVDLAAKHRDRREVDRLLVLATHVSAPRVSPDVHLNLAARHMKVHQAIQAARLYDELLAAYDDREARADRDVAYVVAIAALRQGHLRLHAGQHAEAEALWQRALDLDHSEVSPHAAYAIARLLRDIDEHPAETVELYRQAADANHPDVSPKARLELGDLLRKFLQEERARSEYRTVVASRHRLYAQQAWERLNALARCTAVIRSSGGLVVGGSVQHLRPGERVFKAHAPRVLIVGAGTAGQFLLRDLRRDTRQHSIVGFLDDRWPALDRIGDIPVLGSLDALATTVREHEIDFVFLAISAACGATRWRVANACVRQNVPCKTVPPGFTLDRRASMSRQLRPLQVSETYGRTPWVIDRGAAAWARGSSVAVLGAGGGLGREVCRRLAHARAKHMLLMDDDPAALMAAEDELTTTRRYPSAMPYEVNLLDRAAVIRYLRAFQPETVVFAAGVHEPSLADASVRDVLLNNVLAVQTACDAAKLAGTERFVLFSGDHERTPSALLARSFLLAELVVERLRATSDITCVSVRVGETFGERKGTVHLLEQQLARGGDVVVSHRNERRRFVCEPLAVQLALRAGGSSDGGIFAVDAAETLTLGALAERVIALHGLRPGVDVQVQSRNDAPARQVVQALVEAERSTLSSSSSSEELLSVSRPPVDVGRLDYWLHEIVTTLEADDGSDELEAHGDAIPGQPDPALRIESESGCRQHVARLRKLTVDACAELLAGARAADEDPSARDRPTLFADGEPTPHAPS